MTFSPDSQQFESYVPVYDAIPEKWEDARPFIVEQLKKISNGINIREIGWFLDVELLSGKAFFPGVPPPGNSSPPQFRQILRKVIDFGPIIIGLNQRPHGILFDVNFTLIQLWASATNSVAFVATPIPNDIPGTTEAINMDATNINIVSGAAFDRCIAVVEYIQEL